MPPNDAKWYVLWVMSGQEKKLCDKMREISAVHEAMVPSCMIYRRKAGIWHEANSILFPGYIFLRCCITTPLYYRVCNMPGVIRWLGKDGNLPTAVPDEEMELIYVLNCGNAEEITRAIPLTIDRHRRRACARVEMLGKAHKIMLGWHDKQPDASGVDTSSAMTDGD